MLISDTPAKRYTTIWQKNINTNSGVSTFFRQQKLSKILSDLNQRWIQRNGTFLICQPRVWVNSGLSCRTKNGNWRKKYKQRKITKFSSFSCSKTYQNVLYSVTAAKLWEITGYKIDRTNREWVRLKLFRKNSIFYVINGIIDLYLFNV